MHFILIQATFLLWLVVTAAGSDVEGSASHDNETIVSSESVELQEENVDVLTSGQHRGYVDTTSEQTTSETSNVCWQNGVNADSCRDGSSAHKDAKTSHSSQSDVNTGDHNCDNLCKV